MAETSINATEAKTSEGVTAEQSHKTEVKVDLSGMNASVDEKIKAVQTEMNAKMDAILGLLQTKAPAQTEKIDATKGVVKTESKKDEKLDNSLVVEIADSGKGFQIWRNYNKEDCKYKRLVR
jgi:hypothetical protein